MHRARSIAVFALLTIASACLEVTDPVQSDSQLRLINAATTAVNISVDSKATITGAAPTNISAIFLTPGEHQVAVSGGGSTVTLQVETKSGEVTTAYVYSPAPGTLDAATLDTASIVAPGRSKLRVVNLSPTAGELEIWRTQPDFAEPVRIMTPFPYLATSPFLESSAGSWEVFVTAPGDTTKIATTHAFGIPGGGRSTVVLLDSAGTIITRVAPE
jgi:hypothetical protein